MFKVGQEIKVDGKKTKVLGIVKCSNPVPEYSLRIDTSECLLEPIEPSKGKWKLWKKVSDEGNPVVEAVRNSDLADLTKSIYGNFHLSSHGIAITSKSVGNNWGEKVGRRVELWRGENVADKKWPLFIVERNDDGITLFWAGRYVSVE